MSVSLKTAAGPGVSKKVKVERPRPLKIGGGTQPELGVEDLVVVADNVSRSLAVMGQHQQATPAQTNFHLKSQLEVLTANLKISGPALERSHKATMDKLNQALMSACRLDQFSLICRLHMLELLELRSLDWRSNAILDNYYRQKLAQIEGDTKPQQSQTAPVLSTVANPFALQASHPAGNGKEITNTPELQSVLREEKDNRNAAADPAALPGEIQQGGKKFSITVKIQGDELTVSGASMDLVKTAKIVLNEFFTNIPPAQEEEPDTTGDVTASSPTVELELVKPDITYNKEQLLEIAKSSMCKKTPESWDLIMKQLPGVVRRPARAGPTSKLILREMEGLRKQEQAKNV